MRTLYLALCALLLLSDPVFAKHKHRKEAHPRYNESMLADLEFIKQSFKANYALTEMKQALFGWNLDAEIHKAKMLVLQDRNISLKKFQTIIKNFFLSTRDYHATVMFCSTEAAMLPFRIQGAEGEYFFTYIDKELLPEGSDFPFEAGDKLILFDGLPTKEAIKKVRDLELGTNNVATDHAFAELYLPLRIGSLGHQIPSGSLTIVGCKKGSDRSISHTLEWTYVPEKITPPPVLSKSMSGKKALKPSYFSKEFSLPSYRAIRAVMVTTQDDEEAGTLGAKKSFLPPLGKIQWEAAEDTIYQAYLFELPNSKVGGFVRIPRYTPDDYKEAHRQFLDIIKRFEEQADVLVIDQTNNPGGSLYYLYALLTMVTDKPLALPTHRVALTQEDLYYAHHYIELLEDIETEEQAKELLDDFYICLPVNKELAHRLLDYFNFIDLEWNRGKLLTDPCHIYGISSLSPHPEGHFTKPILVLTNALDISGGDYFPAVLQDNQRATIMGTRTAGAGGFVSRLSYPNLHGIAELCYTASLVVRPDNTYIENAGVKPDIPYAITQADLQNNYIDYVNAIILTLTELINH